jgi:hypothetical protein
MNRPINPIQQPRNERALNAIRERLVFVRHGESNGMGYLSDGMIFTCAHVHPHLPVGFIDTDLFDVQRVHGGKGTFAMLAATSLDVMVLAPDGWNCGLSEGPTRDALELICEIEVDEAAPRPAKIDFRSMDSVRIEGYFFFKDGVTLRPAVFELSKDSEVISFISTPDTQGCSGGPLFTNNGQLLGVFNATGPRLSRPITATHAAFGRRIDISLPEIVARRIEWDHLVL